MTGVIRIRWQVPRVLPTATRNGPSLAREKFSELKGTHPFQILSSFLPLTTPKKASILSPLPSSLIPHTQWLPSPLPRMPPSRASPCTAASPSLVLCAAVSPTALSLLLMCKSKLTAIDTNCTQRTSSNRARILLTASRPVSSLTLPPTTVV